MTYLDTAAEGLPYEGCAEAAATYFRHKSMGTPGRPYLHETEYATRHLLARLLGSAAEDVAVVSSASEGLNLLAGSLDWRAGDEVVLTDLEFPSNVLPWLRLRERGVVVRVIPASDGALRLEDFAERINARTRLVTVSHVSYKSGTRIPFLAELGELAHSAGAWLSVDATQALGRVPVPLLGVDYLVASSYKWLRASHGTGVVYAAPALREAMRPTALGWYSVQNIFTEDRFERFQLKHDAGMLTAGMPNFPGIYSLNASVRHLLEEGVERLDARLAPLMRRLRAGLEELGVRLLTPPEPEFASGIVSFAHARAEEIGAALARQDVIVWAGDGRVRASVHLYNEEADISRLLDTLAPILHSRSV